MPQVTSSERRSPSPHPAARLTRRASLHPLALLAAAALALACDRGGEPGASAKGAGKASAADPTATKVVGGDYSEQDRETARALFARLISPPETATSDVHDRWIEDMRLVPDDVTRAGQSVGLALLARAVVDEDAPMSARRHGIEAAAAAAGPAAGELLENLTLQYGPAMELRDAAARALPKADPKRALAVLEPVLRVRPRQTLPPTESLLQAYLDAADQLSVDAVPVLNLLAADMHQDMATRHLAVRQLAARPTPLSLAVLEELLVESGGNGYLRLLAAQGLLTAAPRERVCATFERVLERESSPEIVLFLSNAVERNCR